MNSANASPQGSDRDVPNVEVMSSFVALMRSEYPAVVGLLRAITGDPAVAEDLAQETFAVVYQRWRKVQHLDRPDLWIRRVAINRALGTTRRQVSERRALERLRSLGTPVVAAVDAGTADPAVWAAVGRLPRRQAQLVSLVYLDDRSVDEAAAALGLAPSTARTHLQRRAGGLGPHPRRPRRPDT